MLSEGMQEALNRQCNAEIYSAYLYLSMSAYLSSAGLPGFARWMRVQRLEELTHAMKLYDYIVAGGGRARMMTIEGPPTEWESALDLFEAVLEHEQKVTGLINALVDVAREEKDDATVEFLQWYIDEQVEEEESAQDVVAKIEKTREEGAGLGPLDGDMASREFKPRKEGLAGGIG